MYVALLVSATTYPLAGEAGVSERVHSPAADFRIEPQAETQVIARVRATHALPVDRGNLANTITFSTTRKFLTPALASAYALMVEAAIPRSGTLVFKDVSPGGEWSEHRMANAVVSPPRRSCTGCTVSLDYVVTGGAITEITAPPTGILLLDDEGLTVLDSDSAFIYLAA
jgi:hypothetical protein